MWIVNCKLIFETFNLKYYEMNKIKVQ